MITPKSYIKYLVIDKENSSGTFNDPSESFKKVLNKYTIESTNFLDLINHYVIQRQL